MILAINFRNRPETRTASISGAEARGAAVARPRVISMVTGLRISLSAYQVKKLLRAYPGPAQST
jgi:hypothetical protein